MYPTTVLLTKPHTSVLYLLDQEQVQGIREQRDKAQEIQQKMQLMLAGSQVAKQSGGAAKDYAAAKNSATTPNGAAG